MRTRLLAPLAVAVCAGCLGGASSPAPTHGKPPPVRHMARLALGPGRTRASFETAYPGGSFSVEVSAPAATVYRTFVDVDGIRFAGFEHVRDGRCTRRGASTVCRGGPFAAVPSGYSPWRVWVVKTSAPPARVAVRLRFAQR
jgi:hypothetical protein